LKPENNSIVYDSETGSIFLEIYSKGDWDGITTRLLFRVIKVSVAGLVF